MNRYSPSHGTSAESILSQYSIRCLGQSLPKVAVASYSSNQQRRVYRLSATLSLVEIASFFSFQSTILHFYQQFSHFFGPALFQCIQKLCYRHHFRLRWTAVLFTNHTVLVTSHRIQQSVYMFDLMFMSSSGRYCTMVYQLNKTSESN